MKICLVRHTTPRIAKGICYGQSDIPLADTYPEEYAQIRQQLSAHFPVDAVYASPLSRCFTLAKDLFGEAVVVDDRLQELNFGDWEMKAWNAIPQKALNHWMNDFVNVRCPSGESYQDLSERALNFYNFLQRQHRPEEKIILVTHAGFIRAFKALLDGIPLVETFDQIEVPYGSIVKCV
ncbi:MAG: alpha-ribazole phosphatase [Bacteroidota bacterium]